MECCPPDPPQCATVALHLSNGQTCYIVSDNNIAQIILLSIIIPPCLSSLSQLVTDVDMIIDSGGSASR